ncbi:MAG: PadR family transcriptional regulator [Anaerolineae bacterium]|jgi:PadR family transcriptional regulator AphA
MSLEHAILGFLNYGPASGYDLKKTFDFSVQHFWPADQSQIYRTLSRLEDKGWAEQELVEQEDRPDRKVYHITEAGQEELHRWLTTPLSPKALREPRLIQVFFAGQLDDEEIIEMLERLAVAMRGTLARYDQVPQESAEYCDAVGQPREEFFWMLTLEWGINATRSQLKWLEDIIRRIRNKEHPSLGGEN